MNREKNNPPEGFLDVNGETMCVEGYSEKYLSKNPNRYIPLKAEIEDDGTVYKKKSLDSARKRKNDEFYTRKTDIDIEVKQYREFFKDKIVYCPADKCFNLGRSNFFTYFAVNFNRLGIKKLICTQYVPNGNGFVREMDRELYEKCGLKWTWDGRNGGYSAPDESEIPIEFLKGDGSFSSKECKEIMRGDSGDGSDVVVVTNPPFSLFREFIGQIMEIGCHFLCIGNMNAISYKEIYSLIQADKVWLGYTTPKIFEIPLTQVEDEKKQFSENGKVYQKFGNICWFTNIDTEKRETEIYLSEVYSPGKYQKYDNFDAIEVPKVKLIPKDYYGNMGVPISFLNVYSPKQFEIVRFRKGDDDNDLSINGEYPYFRIVIKRRS